MFALWIGHRTQVLFCRLSHQLPNFLPTTEHSMNPGMLRKGSLFGSHSIQIPTPMPRWSHLVVPTSLRINDEMMVQPDHVAISYVYAITQESESHKIVYTKLYLSIIWTQHPLTWKRQSSRSLYSTFENKCFDQTAVRLVARLSEFDATINRDGHKPLATNSPDFFPIDSIWWTESCKIVWGAVVYPRISRVSYDSIHSSRFFLIE